MAWVKLDNGFREHKKVLRATPAGVCLWVCGLDYCNRQPARDGFIPAEVVPVLYPMPQPMKVAARLVAAGLWEEADGGFRVHDYHDYQPTAEAAEAKREQCREAGRRGGKRRASKAQAESKRNASEPLEKIQADSSSVPGTVPVEPLLPTVVTAPKAVARVVQGAKATDTRTHQVRTYFAQRYRETQGHDYVPNYAKDGDHLKRLPPSFTAERLCELVDVFFAQADEYTRTKIGLNIPEFVRKLNALQAAEHSTGDPTTDAIVRAAAEAERLWAEGGVGR